MVATPGDDLEMTVACRSFATLLWLGCSRLLPSVLEDGGLQAHRYQHVFDRLLEQVLPRSAVT